MLNAWFIGLIGIWLVIAPFVHMTAIGDAWNQWVFGVIVAILGFSMIGEDRRWQAPLAGIVGVWLFIAGFIPRLRLGDSLMTNDVIIGILLIIAGFAATGGHHHALPAPPQTAH